MNTRRQRRSKSSRDTGTEQRLVEATRGCLRSRGLAETSSRAITDLAGANLAAITYHFGSKEGLVAVALAAELEGWTQPVLELLDQAGDPATRLLGAVGRRSTRRSTAARSTPCVARGLRPRRAIPTATTR